MFRVAETWTNAQRSRSQVQNPSALTNSETPVSDWSIGFESSCHLAKQRDCHLLSIERYVIPIDLSTVSFQPCRDCDGVSQEFASRQGSSPANAKRYLLGSVVIAIPGSHTPVHSFLLLSRPLLYSIQSVDQLGNSMQPYTLLALYMHIRLPDGHEIPTIHN